LNWIGQNNPNPGKHFLENVFFSSSCSTNTLHCCWMDQINSMIFNVTDGVDTNCYEMNES